jgi:hypothetical protein
MRNYLILILVFISISLSAESIIQPITDTTSIPKSIVDKLTWDGLPESRFIYRDKDYIYQFDENKELVELYVIKDIFINRAKHDAIVKELNREINVLSFLIGIMVIIAIVVAFFLTKYKNNKIT